jgi:hypothetical protein
MSPRAPIRSWLGRGGNPRGAGFLMFVERIHQCEYIAGAIGLSF